MYLNSLDPLHIAGCNNNILFKHLKKRKETYGMLYVWHGGRVEEKIYRIY